MKFTGANIKDGKRRGEWAELRIYGSRVTAGILRRQVFSVSTRETVAPTISSSSSVIS